MLKSLAFPAAELPQAFLEGVGFDGSAIDGFARVQESDMLLRPDPETSRYSRGSPRPSTPGCSATC